MTDIVVIEDITMALATVSGTNAFNHAARRLLTCEDSIDGVIDALQLPNKVFKRYLHHHGYMKILRTPILLLDLNGTLCFRSDRRSIALRPGIQDLKKLKKYYRVGIYTSVTRHNAQIICDRIEDVCGHVFDKNLIFTREHTFPFTQQELEMYNYPEYKMKKSICNILAPEYAKVATIVDDEIERIVEKDRVVPIHSWNGETSDRYLADTIDYLVKKAVNPILAKVE